MGSFIEDKTRRTEAVMRSLSLKIGLLLALIPAAAAFAASDEQDDKSYLPPAALRAAPGATPAANSAQAAAQHRGRQVRVVHRRREPRYYSYERYNRPRFGFFPF
jgi:hypothetical protein